MESGAHAIGVDIGGTKIGIARVNAEGAILERATLSTEAELGFGRAVQRLIARLEGLHALADRRLAGIGIGCAGPVEPRQGLINNPFTLGGWDHCDIVSPLRDHFGVPVWLENDADAALLGECWCGAGRGFDPAVMFTFGTGVGGAAFVNGKIYRGAKGEHPELGHIAADPSGPACYCGLSGCLESIASGSAISAFGAPAGFQSAPEVFAAARSGQEIAQAIIERAAQATAAAAWIVCHTFLPERIILGGGIMEEHFDLFARAVETRLDKATQFSRRSVSLARAAMGNEAGVLGAASLVFRGKD
jgi:glucokinase